MKEPMVITMAREYASGGSEIAQAVADKLGVPYVLFLGEDEIAAGMVSCKNMTTGAQTKLPVADAILMIREDLAERNKGKVIVE